MTAARLHLIEQLGNARESRGAEREELFHRTRKRRLVEQVLGGGKVEDLVFQYRAYSGDFGLCAGSKCEQSHRDLRRCVLQNTVPEYSGWVQSPAFLS